jgi:LemA protein
MTTLILLGILAALGSWFFMAYNRMVEVRNPNLVETAKGYMAHERETLEAVISARNAASTATTTVAKDPMDTAALATLSKAEGTLTNTLGRMFALSEAYPDLKSNANMIQLSEELTSTENKVAFARQSFNDSVLALNTTIQSLPAAFIAAPLGFKVGSMLEFTEAERVAPVVKF